MVRRKSGAFNLSRPLSRKPSRLPCTAISATPLPAGNCRKRVESDWLFIPASSAIGLLVAVDRIDCDASDVTAFEASEDGPDSAAEEAAAVQAALTALKARLAELPPGSVGLFVYRLGPTAPARNTKTIKRGHLFREQQRSH